MSDTGAAFDDGSIRTHARQTTRTARYAVLGADAEGASHVWFALHGYGQLAARFLRPFVGVVPDDTCVVAPEALSRFYLESPRADGSHLQRIGASWLTREARELEIADALRWLAQVHDEVVERATLGMGAPPTVNLLGFSQGVATTMRWIAHGGVSPAQLVLWAGGLAHDLEMARLRAPLAHTRVTMVSGTSDHFATAEAQGRVRGELDQLGVPIEQITFEGAHQLDARVLRRLLAPDGVVARVTGA